MEMGIVPGVEITLTLKAPFRGPIAFAYGNTQISIRFEDAAFIMVNPIAPWIFYYLAIQIAVKAPCLTF